MRDVFTGYHGVVTRAGPVLTWAVVEAEPQSGYKETRTTACPPVVLPPLSAKLITRAHNSRIYQQVKPRSRRPEIQSELACVVRVACV
mgnify:CR=1 FL=1